MKLENQQLKEHLGKKASSATIEPLYTIVPTMGVVGRRTMYPALNVVRKPVNHHAAIFVVSHRSLKKHKPSSFSPQRNLNTLTFVSTHNVSTYDVSTSSTTHPLGVHVIPFRPEQIHVWAHSCCSAHFGYSNILVPLIDIASCCWSEVQASKRKLRNYFELVLHVNLALGW